MYSGRGRNIRLIALDVDGVLTDGKIWLGNDGEEFKAFHTRDGLGIKLAQKAGLTFAIITGRESEIVRRRARELGIEEVHQGVDDKWSMIRALMEKYNLGPEQIAYIGDDLNDIPVIKRVGLGATVADGAPEVKNAAAYVTEKQGGQGAVRELIELILKAQGKWDELVSFFKG